MMKSFNNNPTIYPGSTELCYMASLAPRAYIEKLTWNLMTTIQNEPHHIFQPSDAYICCSLNRFTVFPFNCFYIAGIVPII